MKLAIGIVQISLSIIGVVIYIQLSRYCKKHEQEEIQIHRRYILSRMITIVVLGIGVGILGIGNFFI
ncbi:MAG: hypothetical protein J6A92_03485 [Lachnospiraceae bacterium]|nr:hypothetical protein [Lachnospiraceae bacterium]